MPSSPEPTPRVAVLIPCYNEARSVGKVVRDFRAALPGAVVYVYDNQSSDATVDEASTAGAIVRSEPRRGKGNVVRRMLADVDADIYVIVDGDGTYEVAAAARMISRLRVERLDMVTGIRSAGRESLAYRRGHAFGNRAFTVLLRRLFGPGVSDVFSGYRVLSRRFAKTFPASSSGFEIEAEMTAHALDLGVPIGEEPCGYSERGQDSNSKLRTYRDGFRILTRAFLYFKEMQPFRLFATVAALLIAASFVLGVPVVVEYARTSQVLRIPTALLSVGLAVVGVVTLACAVILDSVARGRRESKRVAYLTYPLPAMTDAIGDGVPSGRV
jgi:glycosyltransferase involved in cell wall biosynthesis